MSKIFPLFIGCGKFYFIVTVYRIKSNQVRKILLHFSKKTQLLAQEKQFCAAPRAKVGKSVLLFCKPKREKAPVLSGAFRVAVFCLFTPC
jgi:hypothetical protein